MCLKKTYMIITKAIIYPIAPKVGIPNIWGCILVVHIILELINNAMTHKLMTIFESIFLVIFLVP